MGEAVEKSAPFWFFKPSSSYLAAGAGPILLPRDAVVHYEGASRALSAVRVLLPGALTCAAVVRCS